MISWVGPRSARAFFSSGRTRSRFWASFRAGRIRLSAQPGSAIGSAAGIINDGMPSTIGYRVPSRRQRSSRPGSPVNGPWHFGQTRLAGAGMSGPRILAIYVGTGTQDVLVFEAGTLIENAVQLIMRSPTALIAERVKRATADRADLLLTGVTMGGGPDQWAVEAHLKAG